MSRQGETGPVLVWQRSLVSGWMLATGLVSAAALLVAAAVDPSHRLWALSLLLFSAAFLITAAVRVTVSERGVTAASVCLPLLRRHFPLPRITKASSRWTCPLEIGGWGYRWNPGLSAISLREGDALWLGLSNQTTFVITIDDAETAAKLVNRLREQSPEDR
ncbi:hypothetical protein [Streptomyces sp. H27-S2]|uniref:hypothetical protein n=1 Tax=Streptomyces antarcticus TaxID=2996458 RepID=UPI0022717269|nr:hypothetical protein [Streptomyces sp. H27-S2]MCY0955289.1 hypothetical protein [Streptomyces sp. H27-S2]